MIISILLFFSSLGLSLLAIIMWRFKNRLHQLQARINTTKIALEQALQDRRNFIAKLSNKTKITELNDILISEIKDLDQVIESKITLELNDLINNNVVTDSYALERIKDINFRIYVTRIFYNEAVRDFIELRKKKIVSYFNLILNTDFVPKYFEILDSKIY